MNAAEILWLNNIKYILNKTIARRYGPRTIRTTADTAHCGDRRRNETATPATFTEAKNVYRTEVPRPT